MSLTPGQPAVTGAILRSRRYSRRVRNLRLVIPGAVAVVLAAVFLWPSRNGEPPPAAESEAGKPRMFNSRLRGEDERGQPYTITAAQTVQPNVNSKTMDMVKPAAVMKLENGHTLTLDALTGHYDELTSKVDVEGEVTLRNEQGYVGRTQAASMDIKGGKAWGDRPVTVEGPAGTIAARNGFEMSRDDGKLTFHGPAKLTLLEQGGAEDAPGDGGQ